MNMPKPNVQATHAVSSRLDLAELETFLVVAQLGSFSLAAKQLNVSQPSITARVQRLEARLGIRLLVRTTRHVATTPDGERLREAADDTLHALRNLVAEFQQEATAARQRVIVAVTPMIAAYRLPTLIHDYSQRYPDVLVQVRDLRYDDAVKAVLAGDVDLGFMAFEGEDERLIFQVLNEEDLVLAVHPSHALAHRIDVTLDEIAPFPVMLLEQYGTLNVKIKDAYENRGLRFEPALRAANLNTLLGMLDANVGMAFLPRSMATHHPRANRVFLNVVDLSYSRHYGIVLLKKKSLSAASQSFVDFLMTRLRRLTTQKDE